MQINNLNRIVIASIEAKTWSGAAKLRPGDVPGLSELPERAFSLGRKYLIAPEKLRPFTTLRRRAQERCLRIGTRFLGGFALPDDEGLLSGLEAELEADAAEFSAAKDDLLRDLSRAVDEWVAEPEVQPFEALIRNAAPSAAEIGRRLSFGYSFTRIAAAGGAAAQQRLDDQVRGLGESLIGELSQAARELHERLADKTEGRPEERWVVSPKTVEAVKSLRSKAFGLSFVDHRIGPIVGEIDRVLSALPVGKQLKGREASEFAGLLALLSNEQALLAFGQTLLDQQEASAEADWEELQAEQSAPAVPPKPAEESTKVEDEPEDEAAMDAAADAAAVNASLKGDMDFEPDDVSDDVDDDELEDDDDAIPAWARGCAIGF